MSHVFVKLLLFALQPGLIREDRVRVMQSVSTMLLLLALLAPTIASASGRQVAAL